MHVDFTLRGAVEKLDWMQKVIAAASLSIHRKELSDKRVARASDLKIFLLALRHEMCHAHEADGGEICIKSLHVHNGKPVLPSTICRYASIMK
jgi:hypothetical protein